ncbi:MAG: hypothetical protein KI790_12935, partial [Cyclobacteriaceae bacterium]|nr:hypothetical protein [Cyclobacteriaceae bacterium HetDA_MAG_MS6]
NTYSYDARTVFIVYRYENPTSQNNTDLGQLWGDYDNQVHVAIDNRAGGNFGGFSFDGASPPSTTARYGLNSAAYGGSVAASGSNTVDTIGFNIVAAEFNSAISLDEQILGALIPGDASLNIANHNYQGEIAEIIVFDVTLNDAERLSVENYLSTKYSIDISGAGNDFYAFDATHEFEVAGIGRVGLAYDTASFSSPVLGLDTLGNTIDDGDFAFLGHDNGGLAWTRTEEPTAGLSNIRRTTREWRVDETNTFSAVRVLVDTTQLGAPPAGYNKYVLLVDTDGDFANAQVFEMFQLSGTPYWQIEYDFDDGDHISIGVVRPVIGFSSATLSDFETVTSPTITVSTNYIVSSNTTVNYVTSDAGATAGVDYTGISLTTGTITAGTSSFSIPLSISNDMDSETAENLNITLSNIPAGINALNNPLVYTIEDDDNPRKIFFDQPSATISEATSSIDVVVNITPSQVDPLNSTTVDYAVTGLSTATGAGTDYTLAAGTLTIAANNISNSFNIAINDDALSENTETIVVELSNPTNGNLSLTDPTTYTLSITDNDPAPTVQFNVVASSNVESLTNPSIFVVLSTASGEDVSVDYTISGTATGGGTDFTLVNGTATITAGGDVFTTINPTINSDSDPEADETIIITLSNPSGASLGTNTTHTYTITNDDGPFGFQGPGGVGGSNTLSIWLKADSLSGLSDGASISNWPDISGNDRDATQGNPTYQPTWENGGGDQINGFPVIRFDGIDDHTDDALAYNAKTVFIVFRASSTAQDNGELAHIWGSYNELVHIAPEPRAGGDQFGYSLDGNQSGTGTARYGQNGEDYGLLVDDGTYYTWSYDQVFLVTVEYDETKALTRQTLGGIVDQFAVGAQHFGGDLGEIIVFNQELSAARRNIVENYLSGKYGISLPSAKDLYAYDGSHPYDITGVGQDAAGKAHTDAVSNNILRVTTSGLDNEEYLFFGHDNASLNWSSVEVPSDSLQRIAREWRLDETGETGNLTIAIDTSYLTAKPTDYQGYVLLLDDDGNFSNGGTTINSLVQNGAYYEVTDINPTDGSFATIATVGITAHVGISAISVAEDIGTYNLEVNLSRASASATDISFSVDVSSTATEGGGNDFTVVASPETILAGNTSVNVVLTINNDALIELDETVIVNLSSATNNVAIRQDSVFTLTIQDDDASNATGTGPGGVQVPSDYTFWLQADSEVYSDEPPTTLANDGNAIAYWEDLSTNGNQADSIGSFSPPNYRNNVSANRNGKPVIDFSGGDLLMSIANANEINVLASSEKTIIIAFQTGTDINNLQVIYEQGGGSNGLNMHIENGTLYIAAWDNDWTGTYLDHTSPIAANTSYIAALELDAANTTFQAYLNTVSLGTTSILGGQTDLDGHAGLVGIGGMYNASYFNGATADESGENYFFDGQIFEIIKTHNDNLNTAQRVIIENYLAGKWNINISSGTDIYSHKTSHSYHVAGIGQSVSGEFNLAAQSTGFVTISNPTGLDDGDYLLFGHDNADTSAYVGTEVPDVNFQRLAREWRVSEQGNIDGVKFTFDTTAIIATPGADFNEYALLVDSDGDFSSGATVYTMTQNGGSFEVSGVNLSDGDYFTFAAFRPVIQFVPATVNGGEGASPVSAIVALNYPLSTAISVDFALNVGNSSATRGPSDDFNFSDGTLNIAAGDTTASVSIVVLDDVAIEGNEDIEIDLSNPSPGLFIGNDTTFTYTIEDNDISTQIDFSVTTSNIGEDAGSANVTVKLNQIDASDVNVDYTVTAGSASGSGEDYTLANGTATITAGNLSANIQLSIIDDATFENTETVEITLSNPVNASLGSNTVHTLSINDNDSAPDISFSTATANGSEGSTPANIPVILSAVSGLDATVDYEVVLANTSASSGSDYTLSNGSVTIPAGSSQTAISIAIIDDLNLEVDENIQLRLFDNGNLANANIGGADTINFSINDNDASGFTGPGGVRSSSDYLYWLRADKTIYNDTTSNTIASNNQIAQGWVDFSGNGNDAFGNSGSEPVYKNNVSDNVNQKPILDFSSGSAEMTMFNADDINDVGPYNNKTIVAAFQVGTETADRQVVYEQGGDTNGFAIYIYEDSVFLAVWENIGTGSNETFDSLSAPISAGQSVVALIDYDAGSLAFNGFINGVSQGTKAVVADGIPSHGGDISIGGSDAGLAIHGTGGLGFRGKIFELLSFNGNYSTTQRVILENYLAAKYNADISSGGNDYYGYSGTHSYGVAGIGRVSSSDFKTITQSDAMITISNASSLDDSDYLIFGHNNASVNVYTTTEAPTGIQRLEREWRVSETGELGTISFSIDTTSFGVAPSAGFTERVLLIDTDGDFTTGATIVPLSRNGSAYEASGVDFGNGDYFTFAVIRPEVQFTQASSNSSESLSPAQIEISLNYALGQDLAVNVTQTGGSATKDVDFAFTDGNRTISAGSTTVFAEVDVTNDAEVESDETVTLTLSSPTLGSLGTNTTHTFSINDDDNFRKANFSKSDSTDTEDQTVQGVFVFLNAPDNVNPTEVYIEVTGGTAQNDSIDFYIQARDTVTFAASDTVEFFPINVIDDMLDEDDETVTISIVGGSNTTVGDTAIFTLTIQDNDLPPAVQFVSTTQSGDESFQTVNLAVELSTVSGKDVTLSYGAIGGTATVNNDYQFNNTTTVIPAGSTTSNFQFTVINDALNEVPDETIIFQLNDPSPNASLGANDSTTYAILDNDGAGYEGPGGVGNLTEQTTLWVRSDDATSGFSNGATVATWQDQTANNNDVFQNTASSRPLFTENILNNRPGLVFDGIDDVLTMNDAEEINTGGPYDSKTIFLAFRTSADINTRQMLYEEGGGIRGLSIYILNGTLFIGGWNANDDDGGATTPWPQSTPPYTINVQRAIATNTNYFVVLQYDFDVAGAGFNGDVRASLNGETLQELTGAGRLFAHGDDIGIGGVVGTTVYHDLNSSEGPDYFTGSLGELIVTNIVYNEAQRRIVYNYLAAKYDIDIAGEDVFAYEATHGYDIVGIGRTDAANPHNDAQGTGVVRINNPSDLGDNEFLLIGHDDADLTTWSSTEVPNNNSNDFRRLAREWRADETGDVGNITMTLSPGTLASPPAGFPANYVLLVDADGDFTSGASIYQLTDGGGTFTVNDIDLSGDQFFTIGIAKGTVEFSLTASNSLEDDSPDTVEVTLNYVAGQTATVDYTVTEGTAFGSGVDFTLADGTLTFNTGQQTQDLIVNLTNDALAENDEQFTITLSNPSAGLALGANTTHTYTINDSDQTRKVNFAKSDSTDLEDQTPILIDVFISEQDPIDTMRVFYAVSGTATNAAMGDFQLDTPDTLVFLPTDTLESISIPINDDAIDELDETIILTITSAANAGLGDTLVFTYTIQDNDTAPTLSFDAASSSGSEGSTNVSIPISLSGPSAQDISFDYSVNLSSTATGGGGDYNIVGSSRTILAGQTSTSIDFTLFNDDISELDETIIINLSNPVNTTFGSFQDHTFTVIDDDGGLGPLGPGGVGKTQLGSEMVFWLRADHQVFNEPTGTTPATNGDNVFFWADQSGLGNNAYDTTGSTSGPDYIVNAVNDKPAIDFAASNSNDLLM